MEGQEAVGLSAPVLNPLIHGWEPSPLQLSILSDPAQLMLWIAANRSGKTSIAMRRMILAARGAYPYSPLPRDPQRIWVLGPSELNYEEVHRPIFYEWCPPDWLLHFDKGSRRATIRRSDGGECTITFMFYTMDSTRMSGAQLDGAWFDEPPPHAHCQEVATRTVHQGGWIWMTMTPVSGIGWWGDEIYEPAKVGKNNWKLYQTALAEYDESNPTDHFVGKPLVSHTHTHTHTHLHTIQQ